MQQIWPRSVFLNKVLLEYRGTDPLVSCLWLLHTLAEGSINSHGREHAAHKLEMFTVLTLYREDSPALA